MCENVVPRRIVHRQLPHLELTVPMFSTGSVGVERETTAQYTNAANSE
jgi:hypothetical protein